MVVEVLDNVVVGVGVDLQDDGFDGGVAFYEDACGGCGLVFFGVRGDGRERKERRQEGEVGEEEGRGEEARGKEEVPLTALGMVSICERIEWFLGWVR